MKYEDFASLAKQQLQALLQASEQFPASLSNTMLQSSLRQGISITSMATEEGNAELPTPQVEPAGAQEPADEERERPIPQGFTEEEFNTFLAEQAGVLDFAIETLEGDIPAADAILDVVGVVPDGEDGYKEIGDVEAATAQIDEILAETLNLDENDEPVIPETEKTIRISYTRLDEQPLSEEDVQTILDHPISHSLKNLGNVQFFGIEDGGQANQKDVLFMVLEEGAIKLQHLALQAVQYRGEHVFPGMGRVRAIGEVNFVEA